MIAEQGNITLLHISYFYGCLPGEADQVGTDTEAGTLASRDADAGGEDIQHREDRRSRDRDRHDLIQRQALARDKHQGQCNRNTLNYILDQTSQQIIDVHFYIRSTDFFPRPENPEFLRFKYRFKLGDHCRPE